MNGGPDTEYDDRGRTPDQVLAEDARDAICDRLDRLIELAEAGEAMRAESMRAMKAGLEQTLGAQNATLDDLKAAIEADEVDRRAIEALEARLDRLEAKGRHIEEVLETDGRFRR